VVDNLFCTTGRFKLGFISTDQGVAVKFQGVAITDKVWPDSRCGS